MTGSSENNVTHYIDVCIFELDNIIYGDRDTAQLIEQERKPRMRINDINPRFTSAKGCYRPDISTLDKW